MAENTQSVPDDEYDRTHGTPQPFNPGSEQDQWGGNLIPVTETPNPFGPMRQGGGGAK